MILYNKPLSRQQTIYCYYSLPINNNGKRYDRRTWDSSFIIQVNSSPSALINVSAIIQIASLK